MDSTNPPRLGIRGMEIEMTNALNTFAAATKNELFDPEYRGGEWMVEAVETQDTLADFEAAQTSWAERTKMQTGEIAGFKFVAWAKVQARRGQPRQSMSVIDLGDKRIALPGTDLTYFE